MAKHPVLVRAGTLVTGSLLLAGLVAVPVASATAKPATKPSPSFLAEYDAFPATVTSVVATITLPAYTCKKGENIGPGDGTYDQTNSAFSGPYIYVGCTKVGRKYKPLYGATGLEVDGVVTFPTLAMTAGDNVEFTTTCGGSGSFVSIEDLNTSTTVSASSPNPSSCTDASAGDTGVVGTGPGGQARLPKFGAIDFTNVTVNGSPIGSFSPVAENYYEGKKYQIIVGPLTGGGTAFTTTQKK